MNLTRDIALSSDSSVLLFIDVQNFNAHRDGAEYRGVSQSNFDRKYRYFFDRLENQVIPNMQILQKSFRHAGIEVIYTTIESLTKDGRDRSLDYKITGFHNPKGSWDGRVIDQLQPDEDEIWLPKTSSSVFISTNIDYILRNLGVRQVVISGLVTDQCVESAVRDACDLGYLVTLITDACTTYSQERHDRSLSAIKGYCRQLTTQEQLEELRGVKK